MYHPKICLYHPNAGMAAKKKHIFSYRALKKKNCPRQILTIPAQSQLQIYMDSAPNPQSQHNPSSKSQLPKHNPSTISAQSSTIPAQSQHNSSVILTSAISKSRFAHNPIVIPRRLGGLKKRERKHVFLVGS